METRELIRDLGTADFESWILVQQAYRDHAWDEDIMECGFNKNSGYVYIALENGISICSAFGYNVEYLVTDFYSGDETFYGSYQEALEHEFQ